MNDMYSHLQPEVRVSPAKIKHDCLIVAIRISISQEAEYVNDI